MSNDNMISFGFREIPCNCAGKCPTHYELIPPEELGLTIEQINAMPWDENHPYYTIPEQPYWYASPPTACTDEVMKQYNNTHD